MTLGERIARKRKELGLSQEALGERLGVSRQAIYKWESDASLPEIEKLIALSGIFSVPVGWLLGVEELPPEGEAAPAEELTREQLAMVREIVDGYLAARPAAGAPSPGKRRGRLLLGAAAAICLGAVLVTLFGKLDRVTRDYQSLQGDIDRMSQSVDRQISSITGRVEDILHSQSQLTAEQSVQLVRVDPATDTAVFAVRVVPKTYVEGMTALFMADSGGESAQLPVELGEDSAFSGQLACPLTDEISLSVALVYRGQRQIQHLEDFTDLYTQSFPCLWSDIVIWTDVDHGTNVFSGRTVTLGDAADGGRLLAASSQSGRAQVGLFRDREPIVWYEQWTQMVQVGEQQVEALAWTLPGEVELDREQTYWEAALYTDPYGRQRFYLLESLEYREEYGRWDGSKNYRDYGVPPEDWGL